MPVYFLMFHGRPTSDHEDEQDIGGAYINFWIEANDLRQAEALARSKLKN